MEIKPTHKRTTGMNLIQVIRNLYSVLFGQAFLFIASQPNTPDPEANAF